MLAKTVEVTKVETEADLIAVGAFRYNCYLSEGLISERPDKLFLDEYDYAGSAHIYMLRNGGRIVGTIRLHVLTADDHRSATMAAFSDILLPKVKSGLTLIDGARFAVAPDLGSLRLSIARHTLRRYALYADEIGADYGVASVQPDRVQFYSRLYGFSQISEPRSYAGLNEKLVLLGVNLKANNGSESQTSVA